MTYVRRRETKTGTVSTTLVESYRDDKGRSRQRVLASLYGCATPLEALAKLALQRQRLRKEKADLKSELKAAAAFDGAVYRSVTQRERLLQRAEKIDRLLDRMQKDEAVIQKHCDASQEEIQAAIRRYKESLIPWRRR